MQSRLAPPKKNEILAAQEHMDALSGSPHYFKPGEIRRKNRTGYSKMMTWRYLQAIYRDSCQHPLIHNAESFNHHTGRKSDAFGIIDLIVKDFSRIRGIQACGPNDYQEHIRKLRENIQTCKLWLEGGFTTIEIWQWRQVARIKADGSKGSQKVWMPRCQIVSIKFLMDQESATWMELF